MSQESTVFGTAIRVPVQSWLFNSNAIKSPTTVKEPRVIIDLLPDENEYPDLADFLRSGGILEIGEHRELESFARLQIERTTLNAVTMKYKDLADVLRVMVAKAKEYIEENW